MKGGCQDEFPTGRDLSPKVMEVRFKGVLAKVGIKYSCLTTDRTVENSPMKISNDGHGNIKLSCNVGMLQGLTMKEIQSLFYHEACHAVSLPSTGKPYADVGVPIPLITDYYDCYSEYAAHVEFMKRYKGTELHDALRKAYLRLLDNIETTIRIFQLTPDLDPNSPLVEKASQNEGTILLDIVYDAMFFFVAGDSGFLDKCRSLNVMGLYGFAKWVYEDFEYIRNLALPLETMVDAVVFSGKMSCYVEPRFLMQSGKMLFCQDLLRFIRMGEQENVKSMTDLAVA
jgi:hypothetical protein